MTTVVDFDVLQAVQGPRVVLMPNTFVGPLVTGEDFSDFSAFASVYLQAKVALFGSRGSSGSLTVTVEHSDDGLSWVTAETFTFGRDGVQGAKLSSPKAHLRAKAVGAGSEWQVVEVTAVPTYFDAAGGGGGGNVPFVGTDPPGSPSDGELWWDPDDDSPVSGGSQPGAMRVLDLGLISVVDLNDGPQTLYTPAAGDFVGITLSAVGYVQHDVDGGNGDVLIGQSPVYSPQTALLELTINPIAALSDWTGGGARLAGASAPTNASLYFMDSTDPIIIEQFDGSGNPVLSGGNATVGAIHLYAFVATPAAP